MTLDVDPPPAPAFAGDDQRASGGTGSIEDGDPGAESDAADDDASHRRDLQDALAGGAWETAFAEWAAATDLDRHGYDVARDLGLFAEFDFFWDEFAGRVGFHAPGIPEDWQERDLHPDLDSWGTVSGVNAALTELGRLAAERLSEEHVDWAEPYEAPDDLPEF
ncbi:MAG: hypothetical protein ABEJ42_10295 [Halobacteriaceae archaeon]